MCYMWTSHIGMSSYSLYATHCRASGNVWVCSNKELTYTEVRSDSRIYNLNVDCKIKQ
jgi:hypothetical protein